MNEFFSDIKKVEYEGKDSKNPLAYKHYNADEIIDGKTMKEHLRFAVAYWHTFTAGGNDPFGMPTMQRSWDDLSGMELAKARIHANFEFAEKLGIGYFCFHDRDIAPEGADLTETNNNLDVIVSLAKELSEKTGIKLLWGTANLFSNPRFVHGAASSSNADVFAYAAAQTKKALEVTKLMGGQNYVFWGGREGYETLLNTDMGLEQDNLARFFHMAVDYAKEIGFTGQFLIEPKPMEPTKHQYDYDVASVLGFLRKYDLDKHFKMNIEANHATLAGHTFEHELHLARVNGVLGSVDANQGDAQLGWDTDQFPTDIRTATLAMYEIIKNGGLHSGGLNFDAKTRRASFEAIDLFYSHIAGMDTFAKGFKVARKLLASGELEDFIEDRYSSFSEGIGKDILEGKVGFNELEKYALDNKTLANKSGHQEMLEALLNRYILD
ncbi:xylose isomerase [Clostridium sp.]|jgi:xylose isomerase|uniref:xylose isomerase n=1 Tax=Clostridium sp. TaxID=1506 RepID=UPI003EE88756